ncbi:type II secretion system protein N [Rheinheimera riviphila]|uniref:Type II secretion system protein N n=2 Tax=Rheinheimera riviphila TaxID=1834037 RepID=A0A437QZC1_9GAMM|nr:type II secretion system protein N [Rheinheimera riviphila]
MDQLRLSFQMKKSILWGCGLTAYLVFAVTLAPASLWLKLLPLPADVKLGAVTGTLWSGQIAGVQRAPLYFPQLSWQLQLAPLWRGKIGLTVNGGELRDTELPYLQLAAELGLGSVTVRQSTVRLPIAGIMPQLQLPMPVDATGALVLNIQQFALGQPYCSALAGNASWQQAKFKAPNGWIDLNAIHSTLNCEEGNISLQTSADNPLGLLVKAEVLAGSYRINGSLKPEASMPKEVHQAMQFVGQPDGEGRFPLKLQGQIRSQ